jgi:hypothetical protein
MPVTAQDKPIDAVRSETVDRLIMNYGHGRLSLAAFERRLDQTFEATDHKSLEALTADLDLEIDEGYIERKKAELNVQYPYRATRNFEHVLNIFSAGGRSGAWAVPEEIRVFTIFGATDLDFSEASFLERETRVKVFCLFGAVDLFVREGVGTSVKTICLFGAVDNNVPATEDRNAPRLVVEGLVLFGAIDAKIKRTLKERLFEFANSLRQMMGGSAPREQSPRERPSSVEAEPFTGTSRASAESSARRFSAR